jgi:hypothetical protein
MKLSLQGNERGTINALLIPLVLCVLMLFGAIGFGLWAFASRQDYKDNVDQKIAVAQEVTKKETETAKDNEFAEKEKSPLKSYRGPSQFGSLTIQYPKTWSGYVDETGRGGAELDGYFHPTTVPGVQSGASYALRIQVAQRPFSEEIKAFDSKAKNGTVKTSSYRPRKVSDVIGMRVEGEINSQKQGIMILLPSRDKTIKIFTESNQFYDDFNKNILPNFTFTP